MSRLAGRQGPAARQAGVTALRLRTEWALIAVTSIVLCACGAAAPPQPSSQTLSLNDPTGIVFDGSGNLWVANYRGDSILMYTRDAIARGGRIQSRLSIAGPATMLRGPNRLAFDRGGSLWVADYDSDSIVAFTPAAMAKGGAVAPELTIKSEGVGRPTGLAFDSDGNLWVTNQATGDVISIAAADLHAGGAPKAAVTLAMPGGRSSIPEALAFDREGTMWVALFGGNRVLGFRAPSLSRSGTPAPAFAIVTDSPIGLTFDSGGHVWVAEASALRQFDPAHGSAPLRTVKWDAMPHPHTLAIDAAGDLWFSCQNNTIARVSASQLASGDVHSPNAFINS